VRVRTRPLKRRLLEKPLTSRTLTFRNRREDPRNLRTSKATNLATMVASGRSVIRKCLHHWHAMYDVQASTSEVQEGIKTEAIGDEALVVLHGDVKRSLPAVTQATKPRAPAAGGQGCGRKRKVAATELDTDSSDSGDDYGD